MVSTQPVVGVLGLQGSFVEHASVLSKLPYDITVLVVRTTEQLAQCDGLIIPGGESSAISLLARTNGLFEPLVEFTRQARHGSKALWGTCAGMILCAKEVVNARDDYRGLDAFDVRVVRNQWGRQIASFTDALVISPLGKEPFNATFIRAPVTHTILPTSPSSPEVEVLARVPRDILPTVPPTSEAFGPDAEAVMLKQGNILLTSFHPELGADHRVHDWFVRKMVLRV